MSKEKVLKVNEIVTSIEGVEPVALYAHGVLINKDEVGQFTVVRDGDDIGLSSQEEIVDEAITKSDFNEESIREDAKEKGIEGENIISLLVQLGDYSKVDEQQGYTVTNDVLFTSDQVLEIIKRVQGK